jgi:hypothetical protein
VARATHFKVSQKDEDGREDVCVNKSLFR